MSDPYAQENQKEKGAMLRKLKYACRAIKQMIYVGNHKPTNQKSNNMPSFNGYKKKKNSERKTV